MKLFILTISATALLLMFCEKESVNTFKPINQKSISKGADSKLYTHPYYIRYKTYRKDLNTQFINYLKHVNDRGC